MKQKINFRHSSPLLRLGVKNKTTWGSQENLQYASFVGEEKGLVMVKDNDIYYKPLSGAEKVERLIRDGISGVIYNGVTDRIYKGWNSYPSTSFLRKMEFQKIFYIQVLHYGRLKMENGWPFLGLTTQN